MLQVKANATTATAAASTTFAVATYAGTISESTKNRIRTTTSTASITYYFEKENIENIYTFIR